MWNLSGAILAFPVLIALSSQPVMAQENQRFAYIIGNESYELINSLKNSRNDAQEMELALNQFNFNANTHLNQSISNFDSSFDRFLLELASAQEQGSVVDSIFYFAGHGIEQGGANYLLPTDFNPHEVTPSSIRRRAISLDEVITRLSLVSNRVIVILDSCRDDPFLSVSSRERSAIDSSGANSRYAMPRDVPLGVIVFYCAGINQTAKDSLPTDPPDMKNGVCTRHILEVLRSNPESFEMAANEIQLLVSQTTSGTPPPQTPAIYDQLVGVYNLASFDNASVSRAISIPEEIFQEILSADAGQIEASEVSAQLPGASQYFEISGYDGKLADRLAGVSLTIFFNPIRLEEAQTFSVEFSKEGALVNLVPTDFSELGRLASSHAGQTRLVYVSELTDRERESLEVIKSSTLLEERRAVTVEVGSLRTGPIQIQLP